MAGLEEIPPGEYWVQGLLHIYETFARSDGHTVKLPMDRGEGQHWNRAPGNLYSTPQKMRLDPGRAQRIALTLDQEIPPIPEPMITPVRSRACSVSGIHSASSTASVAAAIA